MSRPRGGAVHRRRVPFFALVPLGLFLALALVFFVRLEWGGDPSAIPSALVGRPAPPLDLPPLEGSGKPGLVRADLDGAVTVVNVFASWCGPCRVEHPELMKLASDTRVRVVGINYKDQPGNAAAFLDDLGNPYAAIGVDPRGRSAIDWGVYGVPETFVVDQDGVIRFKLIGPITPESLPGLQAAIEVALTPDV